MSNLSQYRLTLAVFSLGLLWGVSEVVGDGERPAPLDSATKSIVHRLNAADDGNGGQSDMRYELAVTSTDDGNGETRQFAGAHSSPFASDPATAGDAGGLASPSAQSDPEAAQPPPPGPDVGLIHK